MRSTLEWPIHGETTDIGTPCMRFATAKAWRSSRMDRVLRLDSGVLLPEESVAPAQARQAPS